RDTMSYSNTERYETARHEAIHALAAVHFGLGVETINVIAGESSWCTAGYSTLQLPCEAHELPRLLRTDRARAVQIVTGVIAACSAPAADERGPMNASDRRPIDEYKRYWTNQSPDWPTVYCRAGQETRQWLKQRETQGQIARLAQVLFAEGRLSGPRLQRALAQSLDPSAPGPAPAKPAALNRAGLTPAEQAAAEKSLEDFDLF